MSNLLESIKYARRNNEIRAQTIRLLSEAEGTKPVVMPLTEALQQAQTAGLDLVQMSADTDEIPVCKLLDYHKFLYRQAKQQRKQHTAQRASEIKGIRLGFATAAHDLNVKARKAREFLTEGHRVKIMLIFRGREITHFDLGVEKVKAFSQLLADISAPESGIQKQGKTISLLLKPSQGSKPSKTSHHEAEDSQRHQETSTLDRPPQTHHTQVRQESSPSTQV